MSKGVFTMYTIQLFSTQKGEITRFLQQFYNQPITLSNDLKWSKKYKNPIEMADMIGGFIDNNETYQINMWISIDEGFLINVTDYNADDLIRYLYERFPY